MLSLRMLSQNGGDYSNGQFIEKYLEIRTDGWSGGSRVCLVWTLNLMAEVLPVAETLSSIGLNRTS